MKNPIPGAVWFTVHYDPPEAVEVKAQFDDKVVIERRGDVDVLTLTDFHKQYLPNQKDVRLAQVDNRIAAVAETVEAYTRILQDLKAKRSRILKEIE